MLSRTADGIFVEFVHMPLRIHLNVTLKTIITIGLSQKRTLLRIHRLRHAVRRPMRLEAVVAVRLAEVRRVTGVQGRLRRGVDEVVGVARFVGVRFAEVRGGARVAGAGIGFAGEGGHGCVGGAGGACGVRGGVLCRARRDRGRGGGGSGRVSVEGLRVGGEDAGGGGGGGAVWSQMGEQGR